VSLDQRDWQVIQAPIVTRGGDASTLDAPELLLPAFAPCSSVLPVAVPFDRTGEYGSAAWQTCVDLHDSVLGALRAGRRPLLLGGECSLIAGSLSAAVSELRDLHLLFLDAHGDFNTTATSPSGYLGGMCLAHVCGDRVAGLPWKSSDPFPGERAFVIGGRKLDPGEGANLARRNVRVVDRETFPWPAGAPVWIHIDLDIVGSDQMFAVSHPVDGGWTFDQLSTWLARVATRHPIAGLAVCGYQPARDPQRVLPARIAAALAPALQAA
jgi:arginase family enzyme